MARRAWTEWTEWTEYDEGSVGYDHNNTALSLYIYTLSTLNCDLENKDRYIQNGQLQKQEEEERLAKKAQENSTKSKVDDEANQNTSKRLRGKKAKLKKVRLKILWKQMTVLKTIIII